MSNQKQTPAVNTFSWRASNMTTPSTTLGTSVTPGNNTKGSWVTCIASGAITDEVWGIYININNNTVSAAARDTIVDIGIDEAGGTSFSVVIPDLLGSCAGIITGGNVGGCQYYFPLKIKSGSTIGARASVNNATVGTLRVGITVLGQPSHPWLFKRGQRVTAFGIDAAASRGTLLTVGLSSAEGTWASLGTITEPAPFWWQVGMGINDSTMSDVSYAFDIGIGDASNKKFAIFKEFLLASTAENAASRLMGSYYCPSKDGDIVYARANFDTTPADTDISAAAYGLS